MESGKYPAGSQWRKWDLHVHTPASILNNGFPKLADGSPNWDAYVDKLEGLDIATIGVTDYFTIDGYKKLQEYRSAGRLSNIDCLLPNIEFRLDKIVNSRRDSQPRRVNFHVIFSDDVPVQDIEEHFLHDLSFDFEGNPQSPSGTRKLKLSNIEDLGRELAEHNPTLSDRPPLELGASRVVVNVGSIADALADTRFKGKYILVLPEELTNLISWEGQDQQVRRVLLQMSDMVFSSNANTRNWCLGLGPYSDGPDTFVEEFKSLKPCIHGSDAHDLDQVGKPCAKRHGDHNCSESPEDCEMRYLWIKGDPTFEGLKQVIYEPQERVAIQGDSPNPLRSGYTLARFEVSHAIVNDELTIAEENRPLNSGLVAVCGGRGAGKTAYVDLLANCFIDRARVEDPNSFVQRVSDSHVGVTTVVEFRNGEVFRKQIAEPSYSESGDIEYIAQAELESYIGESSDLEVYVRDLIFGSPPITKSVLKYDFDLLAAGINQTKLDLANLSDQIADLERETTQDKQEASRLALAKAKAVVEDVKSQAQELEGRIGADKVALASEKQNAIKDLSDRRRSLEELRSLMGNVKAFAEEQIPIHNEIISRANVLLGQLGMAGDQISSISLPDTAALDTSVREIGALILELVRQIEAAQRELDGYASDVQQHAKLLERLSEAEAGVTQREMESAKLLEGIAAVLEAKTERDEKFRQLLTAVLDQRDKYAEVIASFGEQKAQILADLDFVPSVAFDVEGLVSRLSDVADSRKVTIAAGGEETEIGALLAAYRTVANGNRDGIDALVDETAKQSSVLSTSLRRSHLVDHGVFYRVMYDNYLSVTPVVKYKGVGLGKLSLGQKATVLLKIYLAEGTNPIIVDSHDDHLDNQYIMDELVSALREAKRLRQIVLVSNNANVVVNSDAEQVIVASHQDGVIVYQSGSIEDPTIRSLALGVLEGGRDAFKRRQQKYRLGA